MFPPLARAAMIALVGLTAIPGIILLTMAGWPDMFQGAPMAETMAGLSATQGILTTGLFFFTVSGLLWAPALWFVLDRSRDAGGHRDAVSLAGLFIAASLAVRVAWYGANATATPIAAEIWATGGPAERAALDVMLQLINDVLSTAQEDIGVNLIGSAALLLIGLEIIRLRVFPRWLGYMAVVTSLLFVISSAEMVGLNAGQTVAIAAPSLMNFWFLFMAVAMIRTRASDPQRITP